VRPDLYDGDLCRYAYAPLVEAATAPGADERTAVLEQDATGQGFSAHVLLSQRGHPAVAAAHEWLDEVLATSPTTPWPHLPVHRLSQVPQDPSLDRSFVDAVSWAVDQGIVTGYEGAACGSAPAPCFGPSRAISRQAAAAMLHRLVGLPTPSDVSRTAAFRDVSASHPFAESIRWAASIGLTTGYPDGTFRPSAPITRQSAAALLHRLAGSPPVLDAPSSSDVGPDHPFVEAIGWMAAHGISQGYADGTFRPGAPVTRRAMVPFLHRLARQAGAWEPDHVPAPMTGRALLL
jgi:hypothetical protein